MQVWCACHAYLPDDASSDPVRMSHDTHTVDKKIDNVRICTTQSYRTTPLIHCCISLTRNTSTIFHTQRTTESNYAQIRLPCHSRHACAHCVHSHQDQKAFAPPTPTWTQKITVSRELVRLPYEPRVVDIRQALQGI